MVKGGGEQKERSGKMGAGRGEWEEGSGKRGGGEQKERSGKMGAERGE